MRKICWVLMLVACRWGGPPGATFMSITSPATTRTTACTPRARATRPALCGRSPRPCGWPGRATASNWPTRASRIASACRWSGPRTAAAGAAVPFILDGNGATLDGSAADPRRRLDPFPRQYLPLPTQELEPARPVPERPFDPAAAAAAGHRLPAAAGAAPVVCDRRGPVLRRRGQPAAARLQTELRRAAHRHHALPGRSGRDSQPHDPGLSGWTAWPQPPVPATWCWTTSPRRPTAGAV